MISSNEVLKRTKVQIKDTFNLKFMKSIIIIYIAIGLAISSLMGIEYNCGGPEMFAPYFGNPFIFKKLSLGASMTYYYSILGLILNLVIWSLIVFIIQIAVMEIIKKFRNKVFVNFIFKGIVVILICFATLNIYIESSMIGTGFEKGLNFWYINMDEEAARSDLQCEGELKIIRLFEE